MEAEMDDELEELEKVPCPHCKGTGWLEPLGPYSDGSYCTMRPCPKCDGDGWFYQPVTGD